MRRFEVSEHRTNAGSPGTAFRAIGRWAPGPGVLIVREGTGWVTGQDGTREAIAAQSVVIWEAGEWVEFGGDDVLRAEEYWAVGKPEEAAEIRLAAASGEAGN